MGMEQTLQGKRVLVMGLGRKDGGVGAARYAVHQGAQVLVTDILHAESLQEGLEALQDLPIQYRLGGHKAADFLNADLILKNPGVPPDHPLLLQAAAAGATIRCPAGLFMERSNRPVIGITGTKGKSLTTHLTAHLLHTLLGPAQAAGNNCVCALRLLEEPQPIPVLELSSWQLRDLGQQQSSPHVACWLNFFPDHMNHYHDLDSYFYDKQTILRHQRTGDWAILPLDHGRLAQQAVQGRRLFFSSSVPVPEGAFVKNGRILLRLKGLEYQVCNQNELPGPLQAPHFLPLVLAALCCAAAYAGASCLEDPTTVVNALASFPGLPHRLERVLEQEGLLVINDSAATTPQSLLLALEAVPKTGPLALICGGGGHKHLDYRHLVPALAKQVDQIILFQDDPASKLLASLLPPSLACNTLRCSTMQQAVAKGLDYLSRYRQGTLLLSPACSGAPCFPDLFVRGDLFREAVHRTLGENKP